MIDGFYGEFPRREQVIVGVTASRGQRPPIQLQVAEAILIGLSPAEFHHGDCIGGDRQLHDLVVRHRREGLYRCHIVIHPPVNPKARAFCQPDPEWHDLLLPEKPYFPRNMDIVDASNPLLALPKGPKAPHSGTWGTVEYALRKRSALTILVMPDGSVFYPL
jgi:hypothetical protein